jgi:hypothetical protein
MDDDNGKEYYSNFIDDDRCKQHVAESVHQVWQTRLQDFIIVV